MGKTARMIRKKNGGVRGSKEAVESKKKKKKKKKNCIVGGFFRVAKVFPVKR